ncbi:MAG: SUMF1/EgtB/PvdO family nonheme iron enzyme [Methylococcales bacterium]|nr:SUMF1/EgtB/PvdO family nonheme iron enzyme [Methylococcales bacterium]MDD5632539.1 SUMF1/EgtB/PvdO family nonheme iron enzyme [Methylococcales bacterium]
MSSSEKTKNAIAESGNLQQFRIFLASPGDVPLERKLAREAITHISSERRFRGRINIEIIAWDQPGAAVAMEAGMTPQEAIAKGLPKPEDCDLAVIIFWSRIGTQLPADFELKQDGSPYLSGTEWEYLNALKGYRTNGKPAVWVYRRNGAPKLDLDDPNFESIREQWNKVKQFFAPFTNPDGTLAGGINYYEAPDDFRQQFEQHLRDRLDKLLETLPSNSPSQTAVKPVTTPIWPDSPYPGLEAFTPEQAPIYFGRGREVDQLLQQFIDPKVRFVAVVGVSGSGKSSLVKAGLLPRLRTGIIGNASWADLIFKPGERGGNPFLALAFALKSKLNIAGQTENEIARSLQADANIAEKRLTELLSHTQPATELLLVVDQFEELFTQCTADNRQDFLALLEHLVTLPRIRGIVTMRADFYARAIQESTLANLLRQDRGTFPLDPPGVSAILQMIIRPPEAAGVELEEGLAQRLLDDAGIGPGAMALIAFTLNQLYEQEQPSHAISIDAYNTFGGVKGAVQKRAESALQGLKIDLDSTLPKLFAHLVEVNEQEIATRRRAPQSLLQGDLKTVAEALTDARLLVTSEGENNQPMIEVAHETVLGGWDRLRQWILDHAVALRARRDLEQVASEWDKSGRQSSALRSGTLLQRYVTAAAPRSTIAEAYLKACKRRQTGFRITYSVLGLFCITLLGIFFHINKSDYPPALATKAMFVQLGIWPVKKPAMALISAGEFQMGDLSGKGNPYERPVHAVKFAKAFEMGQYEVTFEEYDLFAAATGREKPGDQGWGRGNRPVIYVSWDDAVAYTIWLSERTGLNYRLPSEAEWEYAARSKTMTKGYWPENKEGESNVACIYANVFDSKHENVLKQSYAIKWEAFKCGDDFPYTAPVGQFQANGWRLFDMLGNVWEWTQDCYVDSYNHTPADGSAQESPDNKACPLRVLRGGSWDSAPQLVRSASRNRSVPDLRIDRLGFRLARTL